MSDYEKYLIKNKEFMVNIFIDYLDLDLSKYRKQVFMLVYEDKDKTKEMKVKWDLMSKKDKLNWVNDTFFKEVNPEELAKHLNSIKIKYDSVLKAKENLVKPFKTISNKFKKNE